MLSAGLCTDALCPTYPYRGRNVCLAFLAKLQCTGCNYSHGRHDVATLDDNELTLVVQQKLQEIESWNTRTRQWFLSPSPVSPAPVEFAPSPAPYAHDQQQPPYPAQRQEHSGHNASSFANMDPSKVVEFKPRGLQLPTPTSPKSQESLYNAPNEDPAASPVGSAQDNAAFEVTAGWANVSNGDGSLTPESNPGTNTEGKKLEEYTEGNELNARIDWADDADQNLPICPLNWNDTPPTVDTQKGKGKAVTTEWDWEPSGPGGPKATGELEASKEEPVVEITKDAEDAWTAEYGLGGGGSWFVGTDNAANGWDDPPKVAKPTGDTYWGTPPGNDERDTAGANWNTVPSKGKKSTKWGAQEKSSKFPPLTPKPKYKDNGFHKGPAEKDRKASGKGGWREEVPRDGGKKGKKGGKSSPTLPAAKPSVTTNTKFGSTNSKGRGQAAGPKDAFTFTRITASAATPQSTRIDKEEDILEPDPDSLPELPPDLKDVGYSPEMEKILRQAIVPKSKMPSRPSVAPIPENTTNDKGTSWVNGTLPTGYPPKTFPERKGFQMDEESGWHHARVKRSNSKASSSTATENKEEDWPALGK